MSMLRYRIYSQGQALSGKRPVMVFLHGLGGGYANWYGQIHTLKASYDLVLIELPSHGQSPVMLSQMEISYEAVSQKILEVLDHLEIKKATFVGVSLGTMLLKYIVLHHPERVDKYIYAGPAGDFPFMLNFTIHFVRIFFPILPLKMIIWLVTTFLMPHKVSKFGRDVFVSCARKLKKKEFIAWCKMLTQFQDVQNDYRAAVGSEPKGLYLIGELDHLFISLSKEDRKRVQNLVIVENAGHVCTADQPAVVNNLIIAFQNNGKV